MLAIVLLFDLLPLGLKRCYRWISWRCRMDWGLNRRCRCRHSRPNCRCCHSRPGCCHCLRFLQSSESIHGCWLNRARSFVV